jgi:zinc protease
MKLRLVAAGAMLALAGCGRADDRSTGTLAFERYELANGLDVVLHVDRSDPIAAVAMTFHVGSAREVPGRTGFAHLFEHLFFLDSENLGPGGLDRLMTRIGSSTNGTTNRDRTNYFEVVPVDGLEKALWAEADKLGFFINTVTESVVAKEKQVVKNEKRQSYDNQPYGHNNFVIDEAMYPEGHPYRWQVIGSLDDLDAASLADVVDFHGRWYRPGNATLVVAGDLDVERTKGWIERYFGEIPAGEPVSVPSAPPVALAAHVRLFHEDNYARVPQLTLAWPAVPVYHPDSYALGALADLLTDGRSTPFYGVLVEEDEVAPAVNASATGGELAGRFTLSVRAFAGTDLDSVFASMQRAFARFEDEGVPPEELERVKAGYESEHYARLSSVLGKAFQLAEFNIFAGDPGFGATDLERRLAVTADDVLRVYRRYIDGRPYVATSFVPRGQVDVTLAESERARVAEEPIVAGAEAELTTVERGEARTESAIDRSVEPPYGAAPTRVAPNVWRDELANGVVVLGIEDREVPMVQFELRMKGGQLLEATDRAGVANLLAESMTAGTRSKTPEELEAAIDLLGATISVDAGAESFSISGSTLTRNYAATMDLVEEILLEPRFDSTEFTLARQRIVNTLQQRAANPTGIAEDVFQRLLYGEHVLGANRLGQLATVEQITLADLRRYHAEALTPQAAAYHVSGAVNEGAVGDALAGLEERWTGAEPAFPAPAAWDPSRAGLYFVDVPGASQSVLAVGYLALAETDSDFYPATVMNFRLGGGGFASDLTQVLREQRGYTYGIGSRFDGTDAPGPFAVRSSVRSNITLEALELVRDIIAAHGPTFDAADLDATQSFLLRANAGAFETANAKIGMLADMSAYGFPADYVLRREQIVRDMTVERVRELAGRYLDPERMVWLVVGDATTQRGRLVSLGLGEPMLLDREGRSVATVQASSTARACVRVGSTPADLRAAMGEPDSVAFGWWIYGRTRIQLAYGTVQDIQDGGNVVRC